MADTLIWTGSYTVDSGGNGKGIGALLARPDGSLEPLGLAVACDSPSFLAVHPALPVVYAVHEHAQTVGVYRRSGSGVTLEPLGEAWTAGAAACHVAVDPRGRFLVVACWGDGQVLLYELDADGAIASRREVEPSRDPYDAGRPSRAHATLFLQDGRIMTTDLGHDLLRVWDYVPGKGLEAAGELALPKDSGPRHLAQHKDGTVFVVTEYSIEVAAVRAGTDGRFELVSIGPAGASEVSDGDAAAEIALSPDGRHAYVGVRGSSRICTLRITGGPAGDDGTGLEPVADTPSSGDWPRHHLVHEGWLHLAHERSNDVVTFSLDPESGLPAGPAARLETGSPTALVVGGSA
ncbi:lactonase family protein [Arthrobacter cupressi]|uniref:6-phosphogluconolactonase, cycloisomerase 2 family n=1 Tax=Arthrobacter cupressi TaxID=1045773 RepID=A0A1G8NEJ0_9MICC|nr:beta-propeller fold lactonase family protein [Arthrobacter cupressi]NYD78263.1 6-phosphogluconolactonase (cycloisomerase 2 family) [Arthrobacter cupressi]SDI78578.1 6-phosphogluconolactonase, cycloisomerase 2 family [Arthrobacter cupressi]